MGLKEAIEAHSNTRPGYRCTVCTLLTELPADDAEALREALRDPTIKGSWIAKALESEGYGIKQNTVTRHRRGDCSP
jgi:hypothetical protein